jgi:hypothetical protein
MPTITTGPSSLKIENNTTTTTLIGGEVKATKGPNQTNTNQTLIRFTELAGFPHYQREDVATALRGEDPRHSCRGVEACIP